MRNKNREYRLACRQMMKRLDRELECWMLASSGKVRGSKWEKKMTMQGGNELDEASSNQSRAVQFNSTIFNQRRRYSQQVWTLSWKSENRENQIVKVQVGEIEIDKRTNKRKRARLAQKQKASCPNEYWRADCVKSFLFACYSAFTILTQQGRRSTEMRFETHREDEKRTEPKTSGLWRC